MLAADNTPDFRTISDFRKDHLEVLSGLFLLVKLRHVALESTKVRANASRHKAMIYGRIMEKEAQLAAEVDEEEDRRYGRDKRCDELPEELAFREGRLSRIRETREAREAEAKAEAEQAEVEGRKHPGYPRTNSSATS